MGLGWVRVPVDEKSEKSLVLWFNGETREGKLPPLVQLRLVWRTVLLLLR